jgi:hypothetical protein
MSKAKSVNERLVGKTVRLSDGSDAIVTEISEDEKTAVLHKGSKKLNLAVSNIETRGSKFYQKTKEDSAMTHGAAKPVGEAKPVDEVKSTQALTLEERPGIHLEDGIASSGTNTGSAIGPANEVKLTCQFCLHTFTEETSGMIKPEGLSDMCSECLSLAEDRLLAVGIPGQDIVPEMVVEYLTRFYGMVNSDVVIQVIQVEGNEEICDPETLKADCSVGALSADEEIVGDAITFETSAEEFVYARRAVAQTLVDVINLVSGNASIGEETADAILLKLEPFDFELTALCGGYIISQGEAGPVREEEFTALDELFSYFCGAQEDTTDTDVPEEEDDLENEDEDDEVEHLQLGTFYRLQNCKNEANNKKLVKVIEFILPEEDSDSPIVYRVIDKDGKTYKVTDSKLKPSIKSF